MTGKRPRQAIGSAPLRKEGRDKVTGAARYIDDIEMPGMLHGVTVRSPVPRGRLKAVHFEGSLPWNEIVVATARDIPGKNDVCIPGKDLPGGQPLLAHDLIQHAEEPVLLLAHADKYLVEAARRHVRLDIEPLPAVLTLDEALAARTKLHGNDNVFKKFRIEKGDVERAWRDATLVVEGIYETGAQEQLYIENNGVLAVATPEGGITVWGSMQCPFYVHRTLTPVFGLPAEKIRIVQTETGGGFGGKEEYPSILAGHAALLALKAKRPVKMIYSRDEDMAATTKRHPSRSRYRTALDADGRLLALDIEFDIDGGAYMTLSPVVLSRGTLHAAGPYACDNVRIVSRALATNHPPHGAFRGFGAPQSIFALERHMDRSAAAAGLSPDAFRRRNAIRRGQTLATGQEVRETVDFGKLLDRAFQLSGYHAKRKRFARENRKSTIKKGIGFAMFMHGAGFTGSGEKYLASVIGLEATAEGRVRVLSASTEIGQGTNTIFCQIVADALGLGLEDVEVATPDTRDVPNSGPTVASRTCMVVGGILGQAAVQLKETLVGAGLLKAKFTPTEFRRACTGYVAAHGPLKIYSQYKPPANIQWDDETYRGDAYATYAWAVYVAEVSVDTATCETRVDDFVAVQEVGRVVHPVLAAGQIEGGVAQAIGYALYEKVVWREGRMANNQMTNYIMPTSLDAPPIRVYFEEINRTHGPGGAKGIGELPMDGPAPAILSAVENATGIVVNQIPMLPEDLMRAMERDYAG